MRLSKAQEGTCRVGIMVLTGSSKTSRYVSASLNVKQVWIITTIILAGSWPPNWGPAPTCAKKHSTMEV